MRNYSWGSKTRKGNAWKERAKAIGRLSKSMCKEVKEENQEGPIRRGMSCEESGSEGPAQTKPHDFGKPPGFYSKGNGKLTFKWSRTGELWLKIKSKSTHLNVQQS